MSEPEVGAKTVDRVMCPACLIPCHVTQGQEDGETWSIAGCPRCGYQMDSEGCLTVSDMLNGAETGATWNDVDLPAWTRMVVALVTTASDQAMGAE